MPVNVQISLNPPHRRERLAVRIVDTATDRQRSLHNVAALLASAASLVDAALAQRDLGLADGGFTVRSGQQQLFLRLPVSTDPTCDCVLYHVEAIPYDRAYYLWQKLHRQAARAEAPRHRLDEDVEATC